MFRLHIDCSLTDNLEQSQKITEIFIDTLKSLLERQIAEVTIDLSKLENLQYKLSNDEDRNPKNYMIIDENGHYTNRKSKLFMKDNII